MRILFFGRLRDAVGASEIERAVPDGVADSEALRTWLGATHPEILEPTVRIALDDVLIAGPVALEGVAEAAFLPPVSGG
jgi:molybdopterin converting factor small subunit